MGKKKREYKGYDKEEVFVVSLVFFHVHCIQNLN